MVANCVTFSSLDDIYHLTLSVELNRINSRNSSKISSTRNSRKAYQSMSAHSYLRVFSEVSLKSVRWYFEETKITSGLRFEVDHITMTPSRASRRREGNRVTKCKASITRLDALRVIELISQK